MSKQSVSRKAPRKHRAAPSVVEPTEVTAEYSLPPESPTVTRLKQSWLLVTVVGLLALGTFGAGLKYLEESAQREAAAGKRNLSAEQATQKSWLSSVNPFTAPPPPAATPQLSKEYIYAGSRMLAVEDANANAAPPADLAVFRPSNGFWYVMAPNGTMQASVQFGMNGDQPLPGDYDGDGKTDFCVFRPSAGAWYVLKSSDNTYYGVTFGLSTDKAVPADYDGDGKTDVAVYRPTTNPGTWHIMGSSQGYYNILFGVDLSTDTPAPADYDGDGKADIAVWRKTNQTFYSLNSSGSQGNAGAGNLMAVTVGTSPSDTPVSSDYDGDGKADYAIKAGGTWLIKRSSQFAQPPTSTAFGLATDKPVHNDYDGDGKTDIAVWRESANAQWYILKSSNGQMRSESWGTTGDIPVPVFYRR